MAGAPGGYHILPRRASSPWPDTSHLAVRRWDVDRVRIGLTAKREVWMGIDGNSICVGHQTSPIIEAVKTIAKRDIWPLSFTDTCDLSDNPVDFQVADIPALTESDTMKGQYAQ